MEHMGYVYKMTSSRPTGIKYYMCKTVGCNCTAKRSRLGQVTIVRPHNHRTAGQVLAGDEENESRVELQALKNALKEKAIGSNERYSDIYRSETARYPRVGAMYSWHSACSLMTRHRKNCMPAEPDSFEELDSLFRDGVLDRFCSNGQNLCRGFLRESGKNSIFFACQDLVDLVLRRKPNDMYIDCSFKMVPKKPRAKQLLSVHFKIDDCSFPVIYCLMESDCRSSYDNAIGFIKDNILLGYCPSNIFSDFKADLINSLTQCYPTAIVDCTWFYHNLMLCEKMAEYGYSNQLNNNKYTFKCLKMLMVMVLLPPNNIQAAFDALIVYATRMQVHIPRIFDYYRWYWLTQVGPDDISMFLQPKKTIDNIVVFHKKLISSFRHNPTIWKFLGSMSNMNNLYVKVASQLGLRNSENKTFECQPLYNNLKMQAYIRQLVTCQIPIRHFLLLSSDFYKGYEKYLSASIVHMSVYNTVSNLNDEDNTGVDIERVEDEDELYDDQSRQQQLEMRQPQARGQLQGRQNRHRQRHQQQQAQQQQNRLEQIISITDDSSIAHSARSSAFDDQPSRGHSYCMVCLTTKTDYKYIFVPCGHSWICQSCRDQNFLICPYCRNDVYMVVRVLETSV